MWLNLRRKAVNKIKLFISLMFITSGVYAQTAPVIVAQPSTTPYVVYTPSGSFLVVPNYTTGQPTAVIQTSKGTTTTGGPNAGKK